jgi:hypothetical protein
MTTQLLMSVTIASVAGVLVNTPSAPPADPPPMVRCGIDMRNVDLQVTEGVVLRARTLDGELVANKAGSPPVFDDPTSYTMRLASADVSMDASSLTAMLARVFTGSSPVKDLKLSIIDGQIVQKGKLRKGVEVPFSMKTNVAPTLDGRIRLHANSLKAVGIPVKGMLDLFGVELDNLMKMPGQRGIQVEGDDILLAPAALLPPPATEGRVKDVRISGDRLVMIMVGSARPPGRPGTLPEPKARNYLYFHGGSVRFGKLTMSDADLQLVDADPADPFDFFPGRYSAQLVAGYSRTTPRGGLKVLMPDYADIGAPNGKIVPPRIPRRAGL